MAISTIGGQNYGKPLKSANSGNNVSVKKSKLLRTICFPQISLIVADLVLRLSARSAGDKILSCEGYKKLSQALLLISFLVMLGVPQKVNAQKSIRDSTISLFMLNANYSMALPAGDLQYRFGLTHQLGAEFGRKFSNNFYISAGPRFLFGGKVKEYTAANVTDVFGDSINGYQVMAIGSDGRYYTVKYFERGFTFPLVVGKIIPLSKKTNPNSGIFFELGPQFIQHKIRLQVAGNNVPSLDPPYRKGYDRLTNGIGIVEGIGYRHFSNNRLINFYFGFEFSQNFTRIRRDVQYDIPVLDTSPRMDLLWGFKVGWTFPIYFEATDKYYFY